MGYVIVGGICLMVGAVIGVSVIALCTASKYVDSNLDYTDKNNEEDKTE